MPGRRIRLEAQAIWRPADRSCGGQPGQHITRNAERSCRSVSIAVRAAGSRWVATSTRPVTFWRQGWRTWKLRLPRSSGALPLGAVTGNTCHHSPSHTARSQPGHDRLCWLIQKRAEKRAYIRRLEARETEAMPLVKHTPTVLEIGSRDLTNRVGRGPVCAERRRVHRRVDYLMSGHGPDLRHIQPRLDELRSNRIPQVMKPGVSQFYFQD